MGSGGSEADVRAMAPGIVRNVSLPALPSPAGMRVPRVSSFSTMASPRALKTLREVRDAAGSDSDSDGMVPQLARGAHALRDITEEEDAGVAWEVAGSAEEPEPELQPELEPVHPGGVRGGIREGAVHAVRVLGVFVPKGVGVDAEVRFLFLAAVSGMLLAPAAAFAAVAPGIAPLVAAAGLALVPLVAHRSRSLRVATALLIADVLAYTLAVAGAVSPVVLVWTSVVPVVAFATLGNRMGLASSAVAAAAVFAGDFSTPRPHMHNATPAVIIATWVLFLGCVGVVQTQIRAVKLGAGAGAPRLGVPHGAYSTGSDDDSDISADDDDDYRALPAAVVPEAVPSPRARLRGHF